MANVNLNIETRGGQKAGKTLGELETRAEQLNNEIRNVGKNSKEFKELQAELKKTNNQIKTVEESFQGMSFEDKGRAIGDVAGGLTKSFGALQVVLSSTDGALQETVSSAIRWISVAEGLQGITETVASSYKLFNAQIKSSTVLQKTFRFVTNASSRSLRIFRGALIATGLGAFIALIGTLIANLDKVKKAFLNLLPQGTITTLKDSWNGLINLFTSSLNDFWGTLKSVGNFLINVVTADVAGLKKQIDTLSESFQKNKEKAKENRKEQERNNRVKKQANNLLKDSNKLLKSQSDNLEQVVQKQKDIELTLGNTNLKMSQRIRLQNKLNKLEEREQELRKERFDEYIQNTIDGLETEKKILEEQGKQQKAINKEIEILQTKQKDTVDGSDEYRLLQEKINSLIEKRNNVQLNQELQSIKVKIEKLEREKGNQLEILALKEKAADIQANIADNTLDEEKAITKKIDVQKKFNKELKEQIDTANQILDGNFAQDKLSGDNNNTTTTGKNNKESEDKSLLASALGTSSKETSDIKSVARDTTNFITNLGQKRRQRELRAEKRKLQKEKEARLSNEALTEKERQRIKEKFEKKENKLERKAFQQKKKNDKQKAIANGALAVTRALAQTGGNPALLAARLALITAQTAASVNRISNRKFKAKKGGIVQGPSHKQGGVKGTGSFNNIEVEGGEAIINKKSTEKYKDTLDKINKDKFKTGGVLPNNNSSNNNDEVVNELRNLRQQQQEQDRTLKAFVISEEITNQQNKDEKIKRKANLS